MPPSEEKPKKITYRFFEPKNDDFFIPIANAYSEFYEHNIIAAAKTMEDYFNFVPFNEEQIKFLRNYKEKLPFRGCDIITTIGCNKRKRKCGKEEICVAVTSRQYELLQASIKEATDKLEADNTVRVTIVNKIKCNCPWFTGVESYKADQERSDFLERYAKFIDHIPPRIKNVEKMVFASAQNNSNYAFLKKNVTTKTLEECREYQNINISGC